MENNNFGQVKISNDVVATIAGLAALEVEGVETNTTFTDKILKNNGVKIQIDDRLWCIYTRDSFKNSRKCKKYC